MGMLEQPIIAKATIRATANLCMPDKMARRCWRIQRGGSSTSAPIIALPHAPSEPLRVDADARGIHRRHFLRDDDLDLYPFKGSSALTRSMTAAPTSRMASMLQANLTMRSMNRSPVLPVAAQVTQAFHRRFDLDQLLLRLGADCSSGNAVRSGPRA